MRSDLAPEWEAPSETPTPETHTPSEPREAEAQPSLVRWLLSDQNLAEQLDLAGDDALNDLDDVVSLRDAENDIDQASVALEVSDANARHTSGVGLGEVEIQIGDLLAADDAEVAIGLVVQLARVQLVDARLDRGDERLDRVVADAEDLEDERAELESSRALDETARATAGERAHLRSVDALRGVLSDWDRLPAELVDFGGEGKADHEHK